MKNRILTLIVILVVVSACIQVQAQAVVNAPAAAPTPDKSISASVGNGDPAYKMPSIKDVSTDDSIEVLAGRFKVGLPSGVDEFSGISPKDLGRPGDGMGFTWYFAEGTIRCAYIRLLGQRTPLVPEVISRIADNLKRGAIEGKPNSKLLKEAIDITDGVPHSYFSLDLGKDGLYVEHTFYDETRTYQFMVSVKDPVDEEAFNKVIKTFRLLTEAEVQAKIKRSYDEAMPKPLPQTPIVAKERTDAEDDGLKGRVIKVVTEQEDRSGTWYTQGKHIASIDLYNDRGAKVQRDWYDSGMPADITVYGFLDGKRVSKSGYVENGFPGRMTSILSSPPGGELVATLGDERYEYSYKYKYLKGQLAEMTTTGNDGKLWLRYVYKYSPRRREELVYSEDGELNQRYLYLLDEKGNEIEMTAFELMDPKGADKRSRYQYVLDAQGNWTKKVTEHAQIENGTTKWVPDMIEYRTITYK